MPAFSRLKRLLRSIGHLIFFYAKKFHLIPYRFISVVSGVFRMFVGNEDSNQGGSSNWTEHRPSNDNGLEHDEDSEDLICEYDSTWDEYDDNQSNRKKVSVHEYLFRFLKVGLAYMFMVPGLHQRHLAYAVVLYPLIFY